MADYLPFGAITHPIVRLEDDYNNILAHGLESLASYTVRANGAYFEALKGYASTGGGTIAFGGADNAGAADGTDFDVTVQAAIDALETKAEGGVILLKNDTYSYDTTLSIEGNGIFLVGESRARTTGGGLLSYTGAAQGITIGGVADLAWNSGIKSLRLLDAGAGTDGIQCYGQQCLFDDVQVSSFDSGLVLEGQQVGADYSGDNRVFSSTFDSNVNYGIENYAGDTFMSNCNVGNNTAVGLLIQSPAAYHSGGFYGVNLNLWGGTKPCVIDDCLNASFSNLECSSASVCGLEIAAGARETMRININGGRIWNNTGADEHVLFSETNNIALNRVLIQGVSFDVTTQVLDYSIANAGQLHSILFDNCQFDSQIDMGYDLGVAAGNFTPGEIRIRDSNGFRTIGGAQGYITDIRSTSLIANGNTTVVITHGLGDVANGYTPIAAEISFTPITNATAVMHGGLLWPNTFTSTTFDVDVPADPGYDYHFAWAVKMSR